MKRNASGSALSEAKAAIERWADEHARAVSSSALDAMLEFIPFSQVRHNREEIRRIATAAAQVGRRASGDMLMQFYKSGAASALPALAKSHAGSKASSKKMLHKGGRKSVWRQAAERVLRKRRSLDVPSEEIIDALVNALVIDRADDGAFECHETGDRVANSQKNLISEISKIKKRVIQPRTTKGL